MAMDFMVTQVQLHNKASALRKSGSLKLGLLKAFLIVFIQLSCSSHQEMVRIEPKIAKTVLPNFVNSTDTLFSKHQDTVYLGDKFFTGYRYTLYANGDTAQLQSYFNGVEEGTQKKWYSDKQPREERFYINGKKEGIHQSWWPDGKPKMYFEANGDEYSGLFREWYSSGLMSKEFHYVNGHEEGSERLWWDNGKVRANYVIRDGKKYGLLGLTICVNPFDSITKQNKIGSFNKK